MSDPADVTTAGPDAETRRRRKEPLFEDAGGITVVLPSQDHQISKRRLSRQSPIARKIFTFNLLAMGLLMVGVLFLNQFEDNLISQRETSLITEAEMVSRSVAELAVDLEPEFRLSPERVQDVMSILARPTGARIEVFNADGVQLADTDQLLGMEPRGLPEAGEANGMFGEVLRRIQDVVTPRAGSGMGIDQATAKAYVADALQGQAFRIVSRNRAGETILTISLPVGSDDQTVGAVLVSTRGGDIDAIVSGQRLEILLVFLLALISSVALSITLANTIARPLRLLADAAEKGGASGSGKMNPERIKIPDLTSRPDEIGELSTAMRAMTGALFDRIEANEAFAADVAHEIKNPLTSLRSAMETMQYARSDEDREMLLDVMRSDVTRLDRLVTDISNASRLDAQMVKEEMEPFDLTQLLDNIIEYNTEGAEKRKGVLTARYAPAPVQLLGLEGRLAQVFVNLITNAISFMPEEGGGEVSVFIERKNEDTIRVRVDDNGPGIPDDNLGDVFKRFYSERPGQDFGNNSGLGLAISRQIVDAHSGAIWAENIRPDGETEGPRLGARFIVELPG
ncbi:MAG: ATP-binding protein [Pseudomonadota bacterium]